MLHAWIARYRPIVHVMVLLSLLALLLMPQGTLRAADQPLMRTPDLGKNTYAAPAAVAGFSDTRFGPDESIKVAPQQVRAGQAGEVTMHLAFPAGYHLNPGAPLTYRVEVQGEGIMVSDMDRRYQKIAPALPLTIPFQAATGTHQAALDIDMTFYYCRQDNTGVCAIESVRWHVPLHTVNDGTAVAPRVFYKATAPVVQ